MIGKEQIIVGLEVGTSKVCAVVGEVLEDGNLQVIGVGRSPSEGVRKGEIVDMEAAGRCIHSAIADAEANTDVEIHSVFTCVTGGHIRSFNNRGSVVITNDEHEITPEEVRSVLLNARAVNIPVDHVVVHSIRQRFFVDGQDGIQNPVGMVGAKLDADVHVIHGIRNRITNTLRCIKQMELKPEGIAISSLASALAVLTTEQQQLGALVIDMGGGTTDYIIYREGAIVHTGVLAVGGDHITNDIAMGLRIPVTRAEFLKVEHGTVEHPLADDIISLKREVGLPDQQVSRGKLAHIMHLRVEETLSLIKKELEKHKLLDYIGAGVFITGGCAHLSGLETLAGKVFGLPVHIGHSQTLGGPTSVLGSPEYSTAIGLVRYARTQFQREHQPPTMMEQWGLRFRNIVQKVRAFLCL